MLAEVRLVLVFVLVVVVVVVAVAAAEVVMESGRVEEVVYEGVGGAGLGKVVVVEVGMGMGLGLGWNWDLTHVLQELGTIYVSCTHQITKLEIKDGGEVRIRKESRTEWIRSVVVEIRFREPSHSIFREGGDKRR